jgi:hypothetical protein
MLLPVPKKDDLMHYRQSFSAGLNIENKMTSHHRNHDSSSDEENAAEEGEEFHFQCDEGLDNSDVDLMSRIEPVSCQITT